MLPEVDADRDVVDISENRVAAEMPHQTVENPSGDHAGIIAAI
jgi:hypothetical protein